MNLIKSLSSYFILTIGLGLSSCSGQEAVTDTTYGIMLDNLLDHNTQSISVEKAHKNYTNYTFLDAREENEYKVSHIKNAIWIGYTNSQIQQLTLPKDTPIIVYCSVGYRSEKIAQNLIKIGYTHVYNLYGGLFEWVNQGHSVFDTLNAKTNNVHAYDKLWGKWLIKGNKIY